MTSRVKNTNSSKSIDVKVSDLLTELKSISLKSNKLLQECRNTLNHMFLIYANNELERLRNKQKYQNSKHLIPHGHKIFSQSDEDGIIREIFNRIGVTNKLFVEFGVGNGLENNTLALLFDNWRGLWIETCETAFSQIQNHFQKMSESGVLKIVNAYITRDNIDNLISSTISENEIDLLSIDVDGNDYHIYNAIHSVNPRVVVIEYNAKFAPPISFCMDYSEQHRWSGDDCFGASLKFLECKLNKKGYQLVGCSIAGTNAFFVRSDLVDDNFLEPYSAEHFYEPARYHLTQIASGHPPSYKSLENSLSSRMW